jgi:predicted MFS family arabinose efflux permease
MRSPCCFLVLLLLYTVRRWACLRDNTTRALGTAVLAASFVLATATSNDLAGQALTEWAYRHSFLVLGALVLLIYIAVIVWKAHKARQSPPLGIGNGIWRIPRF